MSSKIVASNIKIEKIGDNEFSPGALNQTVTLVAKKKLNKKILKNLFLTNKEIKKLIKKDKRK